MFREVLHVYGRGGRKRATRRRWLAAVATGVTASAPAPAAATEIAQPTMQQTLTSSRWLAYAPPAPGRSAVCIIDTGVDDNPDLAGAITARYAIDGGSGLDLDGGDSGTRKHGTTMALHAVGRLNGEGMIGAWPAGEVVSVRAIEPGATTFAFDTYLRAIDQCKRARTWDGYPVTVISMSLGGRRAPAADDLLRVQDSIAVTKDEIDVNVVAGAGNTPGSVYYPARLDGVIGAGAADSASAACWFSATGEGLDVWAPGCSVNSISPYSGAVELQSGSSVSTAYTAGLLAALRAYRPDLTADQAEGLMLSTRVQGVIDAAGMFRAAGLGHIVAQANSNMAAADAITPPNPEAAAKAKAEAERVEAERRWLEQQTGLPPRVYPSLPEARNWARPLTRAPRISGRMVRAKRGKVRYVLSLKLTGRNGGATTKITAFDRRRNKLAKVTARSSRVTIRARRPIARLTVTATDGVKRCSGRWHLKRGRPIADSLSSCKEIPQVDDTGMLPLDTPPG